jgi:hypothetical protein
MTAAYAPPAAHAGYELIATGDVYHGRLWWR